MGKPKARGARAARKTAGSKNKRPAEEKYTIEDLLGKAAELLDECQFDAAEKFCQRALEMDGDTARVEVWIDRGKDNKSDPTTVQIATDFVWAQGLSH